LFSIHHQPMQKQKRLIINEINRHQGEEIRRDDITLIGFRFANSSY
jgi:serine phosphatase RsbU (regulator of sigma subunit)